MARWLLRRPAVPTLDEQLYSSALRDRYAAQGVTVGLYSYGCFDLERIPSGVTIGRYCSFAETARVFLRNHNLDAIGLTAYLYNPSLGLVDDWEVPTATLSIGDDAWLGHNAIVLSGTGEIGRGAAVAAGAVVTRAVPPYAIVAGSPARVIRYRFTPEVIAAIEATRWWERDIGGLRALLAESPELMLHPARHFTRDPAEEQA